MAYKYKLKDIYNELDDVTFFTLDRAIKYRNQAKDPNRFRIWDIEHSKYICDLKRY